LLGYEGRPAQTLLDRTVVREDDLREITSDPDRLADSSLPALNAALRARGLPERFPQQHRHAASRLSGP
jgi:hypothetical protein